MRAPGAGWVVDAPEVARRASLGRPARDTWSRSVSSFPRRPSALVRSNQLNLGQRRRVLYVENKGGDLDGAAARIEWVTFSKSGLSVRYRGRLLQRLGGGGVCGNFFDEATGEEFWVSAIKRSGSNRHSAERGVRVAVDADAVEELERLRAG